MKFLELFSGSSSISDYARSLGFDVVDVDWDVKTKALKHIDILDLDIDTIRSWFGGCLPDFVWASPDCTTYSKACGHIHRGNAPLCLAYSDYAKFCDKVNRHLWDDILIPLGRLGVPYIVENPRGRYRYMNFVQSPFMYSIYYSDFGGVTEKPTDLFTNDIRVAALANVSKHHHTSAHLDTLLRGCLGRSTMPMYLIRYVFFLLFDLGDV